jgi:serine/threonine protein kinase
MVTADGCVKVGDLGLARIFYKPLAPLYNGDKVVVTIWYRAPELLLGAKHYTPAMGTNPPMNNQLMMSDMWALGCIFAELLALKPIFKGDEVKMDNKKTVPFQRGQMQKIIEILGTPTRTASLPACFVSRNRKRYLTCVGWLGRRQMARSQFTSRIHSSHVFQTVFQQPQKMVC